MPSEAKGSAAVPGGPPRLVCRCIGVSSLRIVAAIQERGLASLSELREHLRAGSGCGTCHPEIEEILADLRGDSVPKLERMENRIVCRDETMQRIEASLYTGIVPGLAAGTEVDLVAVNGLTVHLHISPDAPDVRKILAAKLRKYVCEDLEIVFS